MIAEAGHRTGDLDLAVGRRAYHGADRRPEIDAGMKAHDVQDRMETHAVEGRDRRALDRRKNAADARRRAAARARDRQGRRRGRTRLRIEAAELAVRARERITIDRAARAGKADVNDSARRSGPAAQNAREQR